MTTRDLVKLSYHPGKEGSWVKATKDVYELYDEFYKTSGGIFDLMPHYEKIFLPG